MGLDRRAAAVRVLAATVRTRVNPSIHLTTKTTRGPMPSFHYMPNPHP